MNILLKICIVCDVTSKLNCMYTTCIFDNLYFHILKCHGEDRLPKGNSLSNVHVSTTVC